jgi:hypothetical protein
MDEIKLSDGARDGLLTLDGGAYLMGSQRRGMPQYLALDGGADRLSGHEVVPW